MSHTHTPAPAEVIIVAGHKTPAWLNHRIDKAIALYQQGLASTLLLCGGNAEAEDMAARASAAGIPASSIVLESQSTTTLENALFSAPIIRQQQWRDAIIVSDGYHLPRLWLSFRKTTLENTQLISTVFPDKFTLQCQWLLALLREAAALPYYLLKTAGLKIR